MRRDSKHRDKEVVVTNIRLTKELVGLLDSLIEKKIFNSRAEAIREFCREYITENKGI
jgi:metal-responsive CopG/Arc/MetJ family transcriptional regulator